MANQMIALQARNPQLPDPSRQTAQFANMINMARQAEAAQLQGARTRQEMEFARAEEARRAELQAPNVAKARSEADSARLKYVMDYFDTSILALTKVRDPQQAMAVGNRIKSLFPEPELQASIDETLASIPQDPAQFEAWREDSLFRTMEAKDQLAQEFTTQNLGTSTRVIRAPKYGRGGAEVVEGSQAAVDIKPTVVNVEGIGPVIVDPNTGMGYPAAAGATGAYTPPGAGGSRGVAGGEPAKGSVAAALQTNPGAIKDGGFAKSQPGYTGASGGFATFKTPEDGVRAQENLLRTAYVGKGFNTINKIVNRYAPQGPENSAASVSNYKKYVAQRAGVDINAPITAAQIPVVAQAMREFETGNTIGRRGTASASAGAGEPRTLSQTASASERQRKVKTFQDLTGVDLNTQLNKETDPVSKLIKGSTGGMVEALGAEIVGAIPESLGGGATPGMKNIGQLETIATTLTLAFAPDGRLSTGVSNEDRRVIERQLGVIQDPMIPSGKRLAAWGEVKRIMARTIGLTPGQKTTPTTGASQGNDRPSLDSFRRKK